VRFRHPDGSTVHLAYCSNVHPAEDLDGVVGQLAAYADPVRRRLDRDRLGIGLWLADGVARRLDAEPAAVERLRRALADARCEVVTLNGFPYRGFHDPPVKHRVYRPDWAEPERADHTLRLARALARLLPDDVEHGTISTLPLGWPDRMDAEGTAQGLAALDRTADALASLAAGTGRSIALAVEPEPGCRLETTAEAADALTHAGPHLGLCADLCHMAVQFEDQQPGGVLGAVLRVGGRGVPIAKAQVSAGLRVADPADPAARAALAAHTGSPYLHQTRTRAGDRVVGVDDLPQALDGQLPAGGEWRVHVHLPISTSGPGTTRDVLEDGLAALVGGGSARTRHLEVETYTWTTLPPGARPDHPGADDPTAALVAGIAAELAWTADHLTALGLAETP
jgi:hypothetical protein